MFCDLGGVLGLYVGFSLMTIFEFFELFGTLLWICVARLVHRPSPGGARSVGDSSALGDGRSSAGGPTSVDGKVGSQPPAYDRLTSNDQFQLFTTAKDLPNVNC